MSAARYSYAPYCFVFVFIISFPFGLFAEPHNNDGGSSAVENIYSAHLESDIVLLPGVFTPLEAESRVLPFMEGHKRLFRDKTILDIGTGSGIIGLYAAKLGAKKVIATDIDEKAVACASMNAERLGVSRVVEVRVVPSHDLSAYAVIRADEVFDVIISNPPYSIDLDNSKNTPLIDKGDLGMSIVKGLEKHLKPQGLAILLYGSYFYHHVMVKFARYAGYDVTNYEPRFLTPWEGDVLFNYYLERLLEYNHLPPKAFQFDWKKDHRERVQLSESLSAYSGLILISKPEAK